MPHPDEQPDEPEGDPGHEEPDDFLEEGEEPEDDS